MIRCACQLVPPLFVLVAALAVPCRDDRRFMIMRH